ncbi:MAG: SH3 domain-containing protein [Anaerolineae bacterium]|nr:SH3 domain-containing protein [Anaerolineae bacterium]
MRFLIILGLVITALVPALAQEAQPACALAPRLQSGDWGKVAATFTLNHRAEPGLSAARIGQIPAGDVFRVLDGPVCADGYVWWQLAYDGRQGWTAEGEAANDDYWLQPLTVPQVPDSLAQDEPDECLTPPDSLDRIRIGYGTLNLRTLAMLDHAQAIYTADGGIARFRSAIMQGSYNPGGVSASFGTHDGGGAVDLSVREIGTGVILTREIEPMLEALRLAGFAAWLRDTSELYPGSPIHIHAIAIGDPDLSEAARAQIDGTFGYLRGFNGLPQESGIPLPDTSGAMVVCNWMRVLGFDDLRLAAGSTASNGG